MLVCCMNNSICYYAVCFQIPLMPIKYMPALFSRAWCYWQILPLFSISWLFWPMNFKIRMNKMGKKCFSLILGFCNDVFNQLQETDFLCSGWDALEKITLRNTCSVVPMWLLCDDVLASCPQRDTIQTVSSSVLLHRLCRSLSCILENKRR